MHPLPWGGRFDRNAANSASGGVEAIVVLGCRLAQGRPGGALQHRLERALTLYQTDRHEVPIPFLLSGGRHWYGTTEAIAMRQWLLAQGVAEQHIWTETLSRTTYENAIYSADELTRRGVATIALVTSDFHIRRAQRLFERQGLSVVPHPARTPLSPAARVKNRMREWGASCLERWQERLR